MKLFSLMFLFAIVGALFAGCSSDDNNEDSASNENLVGFWCRSEENGQYLEELWFFADGTCRYIESFEPDDYNGKGPFYELDGEGMYSVKGNKLTMRLKFEDETETRTYTIKSVKSKNYLVLIDEEGDSYTFGYVVKDGVTF